MLLQYNSPQDNPSLHFFFLVSLQSNREQHVNKTQMNMWLI